MKINNFFLHYWKTLIIISVILYLSFTSPSTFKGIPTFENEDKLVHFLMFFGLTCVIMFDFGNYVKKNNSNLVFILTCIVFPIFLGGAIEILQPMYFAPRTAEWFDWFSDITGVLVGWLAMRFVFAKLLAQLFQNKK